MWLAGCGLVFLTLRPPAQTPCYTEEVRARNLLRFPDMAARRAAVDSALENGATPSLPRTVIQIPVVVHVVYKGPLENITDAQIQSQIDVLNADYRLQNTNSSNIPAEFQPLAADVEMEFCLASQTPNGAPTNGITRTATSWLNIGQVLAADGSPRVCYTALGGEDAWDPAHYLNIWVAGIGGGILGFGTLPGTAPPEEEGVVIDPKYFGTIGLAALNAPNHLGRTAVHEIGHYFDLNHIWGGNENVCTDDDGVNDTPVQRAAFFGCPAYPQFSCGNSAMFMNYMDYTDDACMCLFTQGQKARMLATLAVIRPGLLTSPGCLTSSTNGPDPHSGMKIYPNPVSEMVYLETGALPGSGGTIQITDVLGRQVFGTTAFFDEQGFSVPVRSLAPGSYFIRLQTAKGEIRRGVFVKN